MKEEELQMMKVGAEAALRPLSNLIEKLFGGSVEEIGGMWQDSFKVRRFELQLKLLAKVQRLLDDAGIQPGRVRDKIAIPLLNAASMEDDETLQDTWAALLANAANPDADPVIPAFPEILRQLTAREVGFLFRLSQSPSFQPPRFSVGGATAHPRQNASGTMSPDNLLKAWEHIVPGPAAPPATEGEEIERRRPIIREFRASMDNLVRLGIFSTYDELNIPVPKSQDNPRAPLMAGIIPYQSSSKFAVSDLGRAFIAACTAPKSTRDGGL